MAADARKGTREAVPVSAGDVPDPIPVGPGDEKKSTGQSIITHGVYQSSDFAKEEMEPFLQNDQRKRIPSRPQSRRYITSDDPVKKNQPYSIAELTLMLEHMIQADPGSIDTDASHQLLETCILHPEHQQLSPMLWDLAMKTVRFPLSNNELAILEQLTNLLVRQPQRIIAPAQELVESLLDNLETLFGCAERARRDRAKASITRQVQDIGFSDPRRPEEEVALMRSLSVLGNVAITDGKVLGAPTMSALMSTMTEIARRTTGQAIMRGCLKVLSAWGVHLTTPFRNQEHCIRLLCQLACDEASGNNDLAYRALTDMLQTRLGREFMQILMRSILADSSQPRALSTSVLRAGVETMLGLQFAEKRVDMLPQQIGLLRECLLHGMEAREMGHLAEPLTSLAIACCPLIREEQLEMLLDCIVRSVTLESSVQSTTKAIELGFVQALIRLFITSFVQYGSAAVTIYKMLIRIVTVAESVAVRLAVMKLLIRFRCDANYGIRIIKDPDTQSLAATLCRTKATATEARDCASPSSHKSNASHTPSSSTDSPRKPLTPNRTRSRSKTRPLNVRDSFRSASQPLWMYEQTRRGLPLDPPDCSSVVLFAQGPRTKDSEQSILDLELWLQIMVEVLRTGKEWEIYSYVLVHLPSQLGNCSLFQRSVRQLSELHDLLNEHLSESSFPEAPSDRGIRKGDIALCLYNALSMLLAYQDSVGLRQWKRVVSTIRSGIEKWDRAGKFCMHVLAVCCYEIPNIISSHLNVIVEMMQKRITQSDLAVDILHFLGGLARIPEAFDRSDFSLHQKIFSICIRFLQHSREQRKLPSATGSDVGKTNNRASGSIGSIGSSTRPSQQELGDQTQRHLHEYIFTTAYQVMIVWFLAIGIRDRPRHVAWITQELAWKTENDREEMEPQSLVFLDMMHRTAYSNLGETSGASQFKDPSQRIHKRTWLMGLSIITLESLIDKGSRRVECGQFTKRQASGTTHAVYYHNTEDTPGHQAPESLTAIESGQDPFETYPNHMILQLMSTISPVPAPLQPIPLPDHDEFTNRALRVLDSTDTVDGHKAAVIYVGPDQREERDILRNTQGSEAFESFVNKLGYKTDLDNAHFNTQGLDRANRTDGTYTYAWRDRVTEIVFHLPTLMPNESDHNAAYARKTSHIGNDHVKIVFNESGLPYDVDTFASDFNSINIVITPEAHSGHRTFSEPEAPNDEAPSIIEPSATDRYGYYLVQTIISNLYPDIFPTSSPKVISASGLPFFIRQLALTASVLCQVWPRDTGEYTSSWLFRLQQIMKLRDKHAAANASTKVGYPQAADAGPSSHTDGETWTGTVSYGGLAEQDKLISSLDFTRWTK